MGHCKVLGAIRVLAADGSRVALASQAQRRLLALLCLRANTTVRAVVLEEQLGLSPGALRTSISRLRRVIGADALVTDSTGYQLRAPVDAVEYEGLVSEAFTATPAAARRLLEAAATLWDGHPYDEFADEPWAQIESQRLAELHAAAVEEHAALLLREGEPAAAMALLLPLIELQPYRDTPRALLMRALDATGCRTEALRQFQSYRQLLSGEVGTEPSAALVALDRAIAAGAGPDAPGVAGHPAWSRPRRPRAATTPSARSSIPAPVSSFVGRAKEIGELGALLNRHRLITLTGSGGCGKSRLAMRLASTSRQRDGAEAWWVDLGVLAPDADVAEQVAMTVGVLPQRDVIDGLEHRLLGRPSLLVLDNAEHVSESTNIVVSALLARCPQAKVLVTSRMPLGVSGEVVWRVPELTMPDDRTSVTLDTLDHHDALRLFVARAREARPGLVVDRRAVEQIAAICHELDGVPLAIELAAARLRSVSLTTLAAGITTSFAWVSGDSSKPPRHATLRASIEWSLGLLTADDRRLLVCLATFASPFDIDAATAVTAVIDDDRAEPATATTELLARLADVGLLELDDTSGRYRMLKTVQQVCVEIGRASGDLHRARVAHARYFGWWCECVGQGRFGIEHHLFVHRMPDVVAASAWARRHDVREVVFAICRGLAPVRSALGQHADFVATWRWLQETDESERNDQWAEACAGLLATASSQLFETTAVTEAIRRHLGPGSGRAAAWLQRGQAMVPAYRGQPAAIDAYVATLLDGEHDLEASVYAGFAAYMQALSGRLDRCEPLLDQLRRLTRRHGSVFSVDSVGNGYAAAVVADIVRGDLRAATDRSLLPVPSDPAFSLTAAAALAHAALLTCDRSTMGRALEWARQGSFPLLAFLGPFVGCCSALLAGRFVEAADLAEDYSDRITVPVLHVHTLPVINAALIGAGRNDRAAVITADAASWFDEIEPAPLLSASMLIGHAQAALAHGDHATARKRAATARRGAVSDGLPIAAIDALEVLRLAGGSSAGSSIWQNIQSERQRIGYRFRWHTGDAPL